MDVCESEWRLEVENPDCVLCGVDIAREWVELLPPCVESTGLIEPDNRDAVFEESASTCAKRVWTRQELKSIQRESERGSERARESARARARGREREGGREGREAGKEGGWACLSPSLRVCTTLCRPLLRALTITWRCAFGRMLIHGFDTWSL